MPVRYPTPTSAVASAVMRGNRKADTRPEIRLRSALHRSGLRFRKSFDIATKDLSVRADIAFPGRRVAIFVDGCFWHACPEHGTQPRTNEDYWSPKLRRNVERDLIIDRALIDAGWSVIRIWEHDVADAIDASLQRVLLTLASAT